jgi:hypothetical protein
MKLFGLGSNDKNDAKHLQSPSVKVITDKEWFGWNRNGPLLELEQVVTIAEKLEAVGCGGTIYLPVNPDKLKSFLADDYAALFNVVLRADEVVPENYSTTWDVSTTVMLNPLESVCKHFLNAHESKPVIHARYGELKAEGPSVLLGVTFSLSQLRDYTRLTADNGMIRPYALTFEAKFYNTRKLPGGKAGDLEFVNYMQEFGTPRPKYNCPHCVIDLI